MVLLTASLALYFVPALLASSRHHPRAETIWWVNALAGWTLFGWLVCLIWTYSEPRRVRGSAFDAAGIFPGQYGHPAYPAGWSAAAAASPEQPCRACSRPVTPMASFCTMCGVNLR